MRAGPSSFLSGVSNGQLACNTCRVHDAPVSRSVQIRDVPDDVHATLKARAAAAGMSLSDFLRDELKTLAGRPPIAEVIARAQARHGGVSREEIVRVIRELRDDPPAA